MTRAGARLAGLAVLLAMPLTCADAQSLQFFGTGTGNIDRVRIRIDAPATPADIGAADFTIEFWLRTTPGNNASAISPGANYNWTNGNIVFDRDRLNTVRGFGISLGGGMVTFGVKNADDVIETWRGTTDIRDGQWHHVVVQRAQSTGAVSIYIDGAREVNDLSGPTGDLSYPNGASGATNDPFIVLAAEKHDFDPSNFPSYSGFMTELRLSNAIKYSGSSYSVPTAALGTEADTVALYHFNEVSGTVLGDATPGGASPGELRVGGSNNGPQWSTDSPFSGVPSPGTLQLQGATASVSEAGGSLVLTVTRTGGTSGAASVNYATAQGTATAGADYTTTTGILNWSDAVGGAQPTLPIPIQNDAQFESNETFTVTLSNATGASLGPPATRTTTVTIMDDDPAPAPGSLQLSAADFSATEGGGPPAVLVRRVGGSDGGASVSFATVDGTATAGSDYTAQSSTLQWANGDAADKPITVPILDDAADEPAETFTIQLTNPMGAGSGTPMQATVTIAASDPTVPPPTPGSVQFETAALDVNESAGTATLRLSRVSGSQGAISVTLNTADGTAAAGSDYAQQSQVVVNWQSGDTAAKTVSVGITNDATDESNETFTASLSNPTGGATVGAQSIMTVTILDDDNPPPPGGGGNASDNGGGGLDRWAVAILALFAGLAVRRRIRAAP